MCVCECVCVHAANVFMVAMLQSVYTCSMKVYKVSAMKLVTSVSFRKIPEGRGIFGGEGGGNKVSKGENPPPPPRMTLLSPYISPSIPHPPSLTLLTHTPSQKLEVQTSAAEQLHERLNAALGESSQLEGQVNRLRLERDSEKKARQDLESKVSELTREWGRGEDFLGSAAI